MANEQHDGPAVTDINVRPEDDQKLAWHYIEQGYRSGYRNAASIQNGDNWQANFEAEKAKTLARPPREKKPTTRNATEQLSVDFT